jgi:hypothetical protein
MARRVSRAAAVGTTHYLKWLTSSEQKKSKGFEGEEKPSGYLRQPHSSDKLQQKKKFTWPVDDHLSPPPLSLAGLAGRTGLLPAEQLAARLPTVHFPMGPNSATSAVGLVSLKKISTAFMTRNKMLYVRRTHG